MEMKSETLSQIDEAMQPAGGRDLRRPARSAATEIAEARLKARALRALCRDCQEREETRRPRSEARTPGRELAPIS